MFLRDADNRLAIHNQDFVSVAICSFNRFDLLEKVIDAVHKYADMPFELVVADDGGFLQKDFSPYSRFKDKVSHICINTGYNMGLAANTNMAIGMTRSKYVFYLADDTLVTKPFMRECKQVLESTPYIGYIDLGGGGCKGAPTTDGHVVVKTPSGSTANIHRCLGSSGGRAFRKAYWYEVGGWAEDDLYGEYPFTNRGWYRSYFCADLFNGRFTDDIGGHTLESSSTKFCFNGQMNHYPKIFGISNEELSRMGSDRCSHLSAITDSTRGYLKKHDDIPGPDIKEQGGFVGWNDWDTVVKQYSPYMSRFQSEIKRDFEAAK